MEDWHKCQISHIVKYRQTKTAENSNVLSLVFSTWVSWYRLTTDQFLMLALCSRVSISVVEFLQLDPHINTTYFVTESDNACYSRCYIC